MKSPIERQLSEQRQHHVDQIARIDSAIELLRSIEKTSRLVTKRVGATQARVALDNVARPPLVTPPRRMAQLRKNAAAAKAGTRPIDRVRRAFSAARGPLTREAVTAHMADLDAAHQARILNRMQTAGEIKATKKGLVRTSKLLRARTVAAAGSEPDANGPFVMAPSYVRGDKLAAPASHKRPIDRVRRVFLDATAALAPAAVFAQARAARLHPKHKGSILARLARTHEIAPVIAPVATMNGTGPDAVHA